MACTICLEENENLIEIDSDEGHLLNVVPILIKYFSFCLEVNIFHNSKKIKLPFCLIKKENNKQTIVLD